MLLLQKLNRFLIVPLLASIPFMTGCSSLWTPTYLYSIDRSSYDFPGVRLLEYSYLKNGKTIWSERSERGLGPGGVILGMPRGDELIVRWLIINTGQERIERVTFSLPSDMTDAEIKILVNEQGLFVYLISPPGSVASTATRKDYCRNVAKQLVRNNTPQIEAEFLACSRGSTAQLLYPTSEK